MISPVKCWSGRDTVKRDTWHGPRDHEQWRDGSGDEDTAAAINNGHRTCICTGPQGVPSTMYSSAYNEASRSFQNARRRPLLSKCYKDVDSVDILCSCPHIRVLARLELVRAVAVGSGSAIACYRHILSDGSESKTICGAIHQRSPDSGASRDTIRHPPHRETAGHQRDHNRCCKCIQ